MMGDVSAWIGIAAFIGCVMIIAVTSTGETKSQIRESCEKLGAFHSEGKVYECRIKGASK